MRPALLVLALAACTCTVSPPPPDAHEIADRLFAPCCWKQTLADHASPLATELRSEIETRLSDGESPAVIEADFVRRYGDRIRATGAVGATDPRAVIGLVGGIGALVGFAALLVMLRRARPSRGPAVPAVLDDAYADQLDEELAKLDV